jgi:hypothetical protein
MDTADRALLADAVRNAFTGASAAGTFDVDGVLAELGWLDMLAAEPRDALDIVFRALGAVNATATALDDVVVRALGVPPRPELAVVLPPFGSWDPPAHAEDGRLCARGLATARAAIADELLLVGDDRDELFAVLLPRWALTFTPVRGVDAGARMHAVVVDADASAAVAVEPPAWDAAVARARRAVGYEIAGACRAMLDLARAHALERVQFGRPVARFQAVRHRLSEALVAIEALDATLTAAADEPGPETAALAKAVAGRSARTVAVHCQQVLAGIGFTTDHPFHRYLKRTMLLDGLFGAADDIVVALGRAVLATKTVPTLIEL